MPSKQYLLQLGESALLAGLIATDPIINTLNGQPIDWKLVLLPFAFAVAHSLVSHIQNQDQRNTSNDILDGVERLMPSNQITRQQQAIILPKDSQSS